MKDRWKYYCGNKIMYVHSLGNCRQFLESMQSFNNIGWHNWSNSHHLHYSDFCWRCFTISTWWQNDAAIFRMHLLVSATSTNNCLWIEYFSSEYHRNKQFEARYCCSIYLIMLTKCHHKYDTRTPLPIFGALSQKLISWSNISKKYLCTLIQSWRLDVG